MEVSIKSRKNKDLYYSFSDVSPESLLESFPHLADNFAFYSGGNDNRSRLLEVLNDCAHQELQALGEDGSIDAAVRFIREFGINTNPLYVYRINNKFYEQVRVA